MRLSLTFLALLFLGMSLAVQTTRANDNNDNKEKPVTAPAKEDRLQGYIVRINADQSTITVRGGQSKGSSMRQVVYDNSTRWTKQGKPAEQSEFKQGSFVIVLGHPDEKGIFHASRIDLRLPR